MSEEIKKEQPDVEVTVTAVAERPAAAVVEKPAPGLPAEKAEAPLVEAAGDKDAAPAEGAAEAPAEEKKSAPAEEADFTLPDAEVEVDIRDDRDEEADSLIQWGAARAGVIVVAPLLGTMALIANEVYMIAKIGEVYQVKLADKAVLSFLGSLGGTVTGGLAATLIPIPFMQIPIAVGVTYGVGKAAKKWIKDGMPDDVEPYMAVFEAEKEKGKEQVDEIEKNPKKDQPLGDEKARFETPDAKKEKKLYPDQAHDAFGKISGRLAEAAGFASARFLDALKKAGVTDEQIEKAKYTAIGVSEVAKEAAADAAKEFSVQAKVKSQEWKEQAKVRSQELSVQAKETSKDLSEQAKVQLDALKEKGRKLRLEADVRAAEARVQAEKAKAEARIRMAQARVQSAYLKVQAEEHAEEAKLRAAEAKVKAVELSEKLQEKAKVYSESVKKAAAEAKENFRSAAEDFKAKALERADQRRAESRAGAAAKDGAPRDEAAAPAAAEPVEEKNVEKKE